MFQLTQDGGGGMVMDTGTTVTRLPQEAYAALRDAFVGVVEAYAAQRRTQIETTEGYDHLLLVLFHQAAS